jgi:hypothetical protein
MTTMFYLYCVTARAHFCFGTQVGEFRWLDADPPIDRISEVLLLFAIRYGPRIVVNACPLRSWLLI